MADDEFTTDNLVVKTTERFSFGLSDYRALYGSREITLEERFGEEWYKRYLYEQHEAVRRRYRSHA